MKIKIHSTNNVESRDLVDSVVIKTDDNEYLLTVEDNTLKVTARFPKPKIVADRPMRQFEITWKNHKTEVVGALDQGSQTETLATALSLAGYGGGILMAIDSWRELHDY